MKKRPRIYYSASQRALIWERWRKGETLHQIARLFDRYHSSIQRIVAESGGIRPTDRPRSRSALTLIEREEISRQFDGFTAFVHEMSGVPFVSFEWNPCQGGGRIHVWIHRKGSELLRFAARERRN